LERNRGVRGVLYDHRSIYLGFLGVALVENVTVGHKLGIRTPFLAQTSGGCSRSGLSREPASCVRVAAIRSPFLARTSGGCSPERPIARASVLPPRRASVVCSRRCWARHARRGGASGSAWPRSGNTHRAAKARAEALGRPGNPHRARKARNGNTHRRRQAPGAGIEKPIRRGPAGLS
jgi:hypothetical protein